MSARAGLALALVAGLALQTVTAGAEPCLRGVNLTGAEFGQAPGRVNVDYVYPEPEAFARIAADGATAVRLPFLWERLQPKLGGPFDEAELKRLTDAVRAAEAVSLVVVLDPHNYARYGGALVGSDTVPVTAFATFWSRLAEAFASRPSVVFSLMNEPHGVHAADWARAANAAIAAIRAKGVKNLVIVPGAAWTGAHSWSSDLPSGRNDREMLAVTDPLDRFAFDLHQYLDADFSGRSPDCPAAERAIRAIDEVTDWLRANGRRGFLGEVGASARPDCVAAVTRMVAKVNAEPRLWIGWTAWAAGAWWPKDYPFNLESTQEGPAPQWAALVPLLAGGACDLSARS